MSLFFDVLIVIFAIMTWYSGNVFYNFLGGLQWQKVKKINCQVAIHCHILCYKEKDTHKYSYASMLSIQITMNKKNI